MGVPYVPFTFPTATVNASMAVGGVNVSFSRTDELWEAYRSGVVDHGLPSFATGKKTNFQIMNYMGEQGAPLFSKMEVAAFLNATEKAAPLWGERWINPALGSTNLVSAATGLVQDIVLDPIKIVSKGVGDAVGNFVKPTTDAVSNLVKYAAIAAVAVAVVYGVYTVSKVVKKRGRK